MNFAGLESSQASIENKIASGFSKHTKAPENYRIFELIMSRNGDISESNFADFASKDIHLKFLFASLQVGEKLGAK